MRAFMIGVMAFLFVFVGLQQVASHCLTCGEVLDGPSLPTKDLT